MESLSAFPTNIGPFEMPQVEKEAYLVEKLSALVGHHAQGCPEYAEFLSGHASRTTFERIRDFPYLPVNVFKNHQLRSVAEEEILKTFYSSSTSGSAPASIAADQVTIAAQAESAHRIFSDFIGDGLRPYIIFDVPASVRGKGVMSARGAAIMGLMGFASRFFFVMKEEEGQLSVDLPALEKAMDYVTNEAGGAFVSYGFTYILYQAHVELEKRGFPVREMGESSRFLHSGGWKKLIDQSVDKATFNTTVSSRWGLAREAVIDFYGLTEQMGVTYPDCSAGNKHAPAWADVIIRDPHSLEPLGPGEGAGLIQLLSLLPRATPNHSIITDDLGEAMYMDDCPCQRRGIAFRFRGRAAKSEVRGCGDIYASR